jgi:glycerol kinase
LAGLGVGLWRSASDLAAQWQLERMFVPRMPAAEREERLTRWHRAVERAKGWAKP